MSSNTNLKIQFIKILEENDLKSLCDLLDDTFKINSKDVNSLDISPNVINALGELLNKIHKMLMEKNDNSLLQVLKHIYKALRNSVAFNSRAQNDVSNNAYILNDTVQLLQYVRPLQDENGIECIKMLLQFLINLIVGNALISTMVWNKFEKDLKDLIKQNDYMYYTSALLYNIFYNNIYLLIDETDIMIHIMDSYKQDDSNEYLTFLIELFIKDVHLNKTYVNFKTEHRMLCLEMMKELFNDSKSLMTTELIKVLCDQFKQKSDCILKTVTDYLKQIEPLEVTLLLELLASISSDENFVKPMQQDKSLLINCAFLLRSIHNVGKQSENNFSVIPKLSQLNDPDIEVFKHPVYGFKASIVRMLANLSWKNKGNQDELRELDCIPLLLDCCNIDARNPFIIQWVIFAIRNLCENNLENQKVIAAMNQQGVVSSAALQEMGITLHSDGENTLKIVPLDFNK